MIKRVFFILLMLVFFLAPIYAKANKLTVYPNPWIPDSGKSLDTKMGDQMKHGSYTNDGWIKFKGVNSSKGYLKIYDITGHLVRSKDWTIEEEKSIPLPQTNKEDREHTIHWDGKDNNCEYVESGVYIWIIKESNGSKHDGKVVVIR